MRSAGDMDNKRIEIEGKIQSEFAVRTHSVTDRINNCIWIDIDTKPTASVRGAYVLGKEWRYIVHSPAHRNRRMGEWITEEDMMNILRRIFKQNDQMRLF